MRLRQPTDFLILEALQSEGRNVATNLAHHTDKSRKNINSRLPVLADYGLVRKIGPAERSGLYEITKKGRIALMYQDKYDEVDDFGSLIEGPHASDQQAGAQQQAQLVRGSDEEDENEDDE
ncbi:winged helix-turn-helix transcriptional regulator [Haloarchaeobius sp. HRN-SO-5]|uniref:winged helix-turn-helix transcriptional regulator n=1 Tax=Haloarchaeobius sp. HRN-SO-5 TaxID=3446118 RepID=UPI003EBEBA92